jgi:hypothetical protein
MSVIEADQPPRRETNCFRIETEVTIAEGEALKVLAKQRGLSARGLIRFLVRRELEREG